MTFSVQPFGMPSDMPQRVLLTAYTDGKTQGELATCSLCMTEAEADDLERQLRTHREQRRAVGVSP